MSFKVIGIGEVLWDLLPSGPQLGGAPANFAFHARQLGADARVISRIGKDTYGRQILERFAAMNLSADTLQVDDQLPTGTAGVNLGPAGTPLFTIKDGAAWDALELQPIALEAAQNTNAICFGTLAQRRSTSASVIQQLVAATPPAALRVFDINLRQQFYTRELLERCLTLANVLKLNDQELFILSPMFDLTGSLRQKIEQLASRFELRCVALTRAERGSLLYQSGHWSELPGRKTQIVDTVGAGDSFTAALVMGLLHQCALEDIHRLAADVAEFVCSRSGATPTLPADLCAAFLSGSTSARPA